MRRLQRNRELQAELIQVQGDSLTELEAVLGSYQRQYAAGTKSWLDVLNIQRELSEQQLQLVQAQSDWVIDIGPGAGDAGGKVVVSGTPQVVAACTDSRTAAFLAKAL